MARKVDITEKLSFDEGAYLVIRGKELKVNDDASTVLKAMGVMSNDVGAEQVVNMYNLIFGEEERKEIDSMKLNFRDFKKVVESAVDLITGNSEDDQGEDQTHTTT